MKKVPKSKQKTISGNYKTPYIPNKLNILAFNTVNKINIKAKPFPMTASSSFANVSLIALFLSLIHMNNYFYRNYFDLSKNMFILERRQIFI